MSMETISHPNQLAKLIKTYRKKRNLTQDELAILIGMGRGIISDIEAGTGLPSVPTLFKLCKVLKLELWLDPEWNYSEEEEDAGTPADPSDS